MFFYREIIYKYDLPREIHNEATGIQTNILIDEADIVGKGANAVISMFDFYINKINSDHVVLFADNCVDQNKNNAILHYLLWRVITKKKKEFTKENVDCQSLFVKIPNVSSPNGFNVAVPSKDPVTNVRYIEWYSWDSCLKQHFKSIPELTKYHHFTFHENGEMKK